MRNILIKFFAIIILITTIFSTACYSEEEKSEMSGAKKYFYVGMKLIEKEVDGYSLSKDAYSSDNTSATYNGIKYTSSGSKIIREDGAEILLRSKDFVGTSTTFDKLYYLYQDINDDEHFSFKHIQFVDDKIFVVAVGYDEIYSWPNMLFLYDISTNTLKYCGYAEDDKYPFKGLNVVYEDWYTPADTNYGVVKK